MLSKVKSIALNGLEGNIIEIQTYISNGFPEFEIIGLPDTSVRESKKRVRAAIKNSNIEFNSRKILINLAPASVKKEGSKFDLAMAIGILLAIGKLDKLNRKIDDIAFIGELSLDGTINSVNGILASCIESKRLGIKTVVIPKGNENEVSIYKEVEIVPVKSLAEVINFLILNISPKINNENKIVKKLEKIDFQDVKGQENVKRGLEITAAGGHNCIMIGSPGVGKTMMAKRLKTILPDMSLEESIEVTKIFSICGKLENNNIINERPFRMPHHTISISNIICGGRNLTPGEICLANKGILFLDELTEFKKGVLEALREPLENKYLVINKSNNIYKFPTNFIFLASINPCPCGYYGDDRKICKCTDKEISRYLRKISGPLIDRIDIQIEVKRSKIDEIQNNYKIETSSEIKKRVIAARKIQEERYKDFGIKLNSELDTKLVSKFCVIDDKCKELMNKAYEKFNLSVRSYERILKVARTIADLDSSQNIELKHIAEAIQYRCIDKFLK